MELKLFVIRICKLALFLSILSTKPLYSAEIISTIKPIDSLVKSIVGDVNSTDILLRGSRSIHGFHLKPSDVKLLNKAEVIIYINDDFETFMPKVIATLPSHIRKIAISDFKGLVLYNMREDFHEEEIDEAEEHEAEHHHEGLDMHIWLSVKNSIIIAQNITDQLSQIYPQNKSLYQQNFDQLRQRLEQLDLDLADKLLDAQNNRVIVFHDAYQYFEKSYGLKIFDVISLNPTKLNSIKHIQQLKHEIQANNISCILAEPQFDTKLVNLISENTDVKVSVIDPLAANINPDANLYFTLMNDMLESWLCE